VKYILHFKDGHDEIEEVPEFMARNWFDNRTNIESWETWYPEWQGNKPEQEQKGAGK
jgi:hypothetical protein